MTLNIEKNCKCVDSQTCFERLSANREISAHSLSQLRSFLEELKHGTKKYKTIASLNEQLAQDYRGRCVLELLQNAHDALHPTPKSHSGRVTFLLKTEPTPILYVANSGNAFSKGDFKSLCQLGQSLKDPNTSIGNKGLGFRSVLEVASAPEIWSSPPMRGEPEFVFRFHPDIRETVAIAIEKLVENGLDTLSPFDNSERLVDWTENQLDTYRDRLFNDSLNATNEVQSYLSPYDIPLVINESRDEVSELLANGHVSVVCLPLDGGRTKDALNAMESVCNQLESLLDISTILFLPHLTTLIVQIDDERTEMHRNVQEDHPFGQHQHSRCQKVCISLNTSTTKESQSECFRMWHRSLGGQEDPSWATLIHEAVQHLPNNWPKLNSLELAVAVKEHEQVTEGRFVIFLPTEMKTGTGAHINAPFFGSLNRRDIDFEDKYNKLLLQCVVDLSLDAVRELMLEDPHESSGRAIVDILASRDEVGKTGTSMFSLIRDQAENQEFPLNEAPLILCDEGWTRTTDARVLPRIPEDSKIGRTLWRKATTFRVISDSLKERTEVVSSLVESLGGTTQPSHPQWIKTTEKLASLVKTHDIHVTWNDFLTSVLVVLPQELTREPVRSSEDVFKSAKILPVQDGRLVSADDEIRVFFQPVRGVDDAAELVGSVPDSLKERIAFIHDQVRTHEDGQSRRSTPVHKFLDGRYVRSFRREDIFREVVRPAWPQMPVLFKSGEAMLCADLLGWTFTLLGSNPSDELINVIKELPLACYGGWYSAQEASFGPGWSGDIGENMWELCDELPRREAKRLRETLLLKPSDRSWGVEVSEHEELFARAGVTDGFRLTGVEDIQFEMYKPRYDLPKTVPKSFDEDSWEEWRTVTSKEIACRFVNIARYSLEGLYNLTELRYVSKLSPNGQCAFSGLILDSIIHWAEGWEEARIRRLVQGGEWTQSITSPLKFLLGKIPWLIDGSQGVYPLSNRWYVPMSYLRGQYERFRHLRPLSLDLSSRLEHETQLLDSLEALGLNIYPTDGKKIGPELLDALATAWREERVQPAMFDQFLGQLRHAWKHLDETKGLPKQFIVWTTRRHFEVLGVDCLRTIYLPDEADKSRALREHNKSVLEMEIRDAQRLADVLLETPEIRRASDLEESVLIDELEWSGESDTALRLEDTRYRWLPTPLLAIHAHGGSNPTGTATKTWSAARDRLREARVFECQSIKVALVDGEETIATSKPSARWLEGNILVVTSEVNNSYLQLAESTESLLDRQDLRKDLNLVFKFLSGIDSPSSQEIEHALAPAQIDPQTYADIHSLWIGNVAWLVERIKPVVILLNVDQEAFENSADDLDSLKTWLKDNISIWETNKLLSAARRSRDDYEMGIETWQVLGNKAELPFWNTVLENLEGDYKPVENKHVVEQVSFHLEEARSILTALARKLALDCGNPDVFLKIEKVNQSFTAPENWSKRWWKVPFVAVIGALKEKYEEILDALYLQLISRGSSIEDLQCVLEKLGVQVSQDPYEIFRRNESQLKEVFKDAYDLYRIWLEHNDIEQRTTEYPTLNGLGSDAYLAQLTDEELWHRACGVINDERFNLACNGLCDVKTIKTVLGLDETTLKELQQKRADDEIEKIRQKRIVEIAGESIEIGLIDFEKMFRQHATRLALPVGPNVKDDEFTSLGNVVDSTNRNSDNRRSNKRVRIPRLSPEETTVVGIVGEMHAFRFLREEFGGRAVRPHAWVSETRLKVIPLVDGEPDEISDGLGFDFRFGHNGIRWYVEVKATKGEHLSFELGISEIDAATRIARLSSDLHRWRILRVRHALSEEPQIDWLPNPFEEGYENKFRFHRGGMVVSYSRSR